MSLCEYVTEATPKQAEGLAHLQTVSETIVRHLRHKFPHDVEWRMLEKWWNGRVLLGSDENSVTFDADKGCLLVGVPKDGGVLGILTAKVLLALSRGASSGKACSSLHHTILKEAAALNIRYSLTCSDILEHGLTDQFPEAACYRFRLTWPEFVGLPLSSVVSAFRKSGRRVEIMTWDTMYGRPASPHVVRVVYDPKTELVVSPAPHVGTVPPPMQDDQCFIKPDDTSTVSCIGAPLGYPPKEWDQYVGKYFTEVVDSLRMQYPHATIEAHPSIAAISKDYRRDRIRVVFNPTTAKVSMVPMIG